MESIARSRLAFAHRADARRHSSWHTRDRRCRRKKRSPSRRRHPRDLGQKALAKVGSVSQEAVRERAFRETAEVNGCHPEPFDKLRAGSAALPKEPEP